MGCAMSQAEKEATQRSLEIDRTLASDNVYRQNEIKLLLLGELIHGEETGNPPLKTALRPSNI